MMHALRQVYRYYMEGFYDMIATLAGIVQTVLYCDFFYLYITKGESIVALLFENIHSATVTRVAIILIVFVNKSWTCYIASFDVRLQAQGIYALLTYAIITIKKTYFEFWFQHPSNEVVCIYEWICIVVSTWV